MTKKAALWGIGRLFQKHSSRRSSGVSRRAGKRPHLGLHHRRLQTEALEDRLLLSVVSSTTPDLTAGTVEAGTQILAVRFNNEVAGAGTAANYELRAAGSDGLLGTSDDPIQPLTVVYRGAVATLSAAPLAEDVYRLTVRDAITDQADNKLDGNGDGTAGGDWVRDFVVTPSSRLFGGMPTYPSGGIEPNSLATGDFNGDGIVDIAVANTSDSVAISSGNVAVLLGNGVGGFATSAIFSTGASSLTSLAVGDFNRDGKSDVVVANYKDRTVEGLLGNGAGGFASAAKFACGGIDSTPRAVAIADFNGDGKSDVVVANGSSNTVGIMFGDGSGALGSAAQYASGGNCACYVAVGDFNRDSKPDIAVCNVYDHKVTVLLNDGRGGFADGAVYSDATGARVLAVGDFNADGISDLAQEVGGRLGVLLGNGRGGFGSPSIIPGVPSISSLLATDVNGDGSVDLVSNGICVFLNQGNGSFAAPMKFNAGALSESTVMGDFNADGKIDVAAANWGSGSIGIMLGIGDGSFVTTRPILVGERSQSRLVTADFNGDGQPDLAADGSGGRGVDLFLANGSGGFADPVNYSTGGEAAYLAVGDFNGDGEYDLVVTNYSPSAGVASVLLGNGNGGFAAPITFSTGGIHPIDVTVGDFNGDGRDDLTVINAESNNVTVFLGNGDGTFGVSTVIASGTSYARSVAVGDFDGDGKADLAMSLMDHLAIFEGNGRGGFSAGTTLLPHTSPETLLSRDYNNDGRLDLLVVDRVDDTVTLLLGNVLGGFATPINFYVGAFCPNAVVLGDYNRDGKVDLAFSTDYGAVSILLGNGPASFAAPMIFATGSTGACDVVSGDFTCDGQADLVVGVTNRNGIILLSNMFGPLPTTLTAPGGAPFDIAAGKFGNGELVQGSYNAFDGYGRLTVGGMAYQPTLFNTSLSDSGRTMITGTGLVGGLVVSRKITVPAIGSEDFARTIDSFTNSTASPITTTVRIVGNLGSDGATTVFATSDGDTIVEASDQWIGTDDADGSGTPAVIHYIHGPAGLRPTSVNVVGDNIEWTYDITVPAGQTVCLATLTIVAETRAAAQAAANTLVTPGAFGGQAGEFLGSSDLASLANFQFPVYHTPTDLALSASSVAENQPSDTTVGTFSTTDPDVGDSFAYTLVSGVGSDDNASFTIVGNQLKTAASFDYETKSSYAVRVRTADGDGLWFEKSLTIGVLDVNEAPTGLMLSADTIAENSPIGTVVGTLSAADPDAGDTFTYTLISGAGSDDNTSFTVSGNLLKTAAVLNVQARSSYSIRLRVTDYAGLTYEKAFTIDVVAATRTSSIGGRVWLDSNSNGIQDPGEPSVAGAAIEVFSSMDTTIGNADDLSCGQAITDASGHYAFSALTDGLSYYEVCHAPVGYAFTTANAGSDRIVDSDPNASGVIGLFTVPAGQSDTSRDAGLVGAAPSSDWTLQIGESGYSSGAAIARDATGNVYVTGRFQGTTDFDPGPGTYNLTGLGAFETFVAKYTWAGALVWARGLPGQGYGTGIAVGADGSVYTTGNFWGTVDFDPGPNAYALTCAAGVGAADVFVSKLDTAGNFVWACRLGGRGANQASDIAVATDGTVYATGYFSGTADFDPGPSTFNLTSAGDAEGFVLRLDAAGQFVWAGSLHGTSYAIGIAVTSDGSVCTTGSFVGRVDFDPGPGTYNLDGSYDLFAWKLDAADNFVWGRSLGRTGQVSGIAVATDGSIYTTGCFQGTADFDPGPSTYNLTSAGNWDVFVSKFDASGNFVWARRVGGTSDDRGGRVAVAPDGSVCTTGLFQGTADFDPGPDTYSLTSAGGFDAFVLKLDASGNFVCARRLGETGNDGGNGIALAGDGSVYITGSFAQMNNSDVLVWKLDLTPPALTVQRLLTRDASPTLSGTVDDPTATVRVTVAGQTYTAATSDGMWSLPQGTITPALADGRYDVTVTGTDTSSNVSTDPTSGELLIDSTPPTSKVNALSQRESSLNFSVSVTTSDPGPAAGVPTSGVASYDLYVSMDAQAWSLWITVPATSGSAMFTGQNGHSYSFYSVAVDKAGNREAAPAAADTSTLIQTASYASTTALSVSRKSSVFGQSLTFTAQVKAVPRGKHPTGTVTFWDGGTRLGTVRVESNGKAAFKTSALTAGTHTITASYSGDTKLAPSSATLRQTVSRAATRISVTSSPKPSALGQLVTFTAQVKVKHPGAGVPTGTMIFKEGTQILGTVVLDASGRARFCTSALGAGSHTITVCYGGSANFAVSSENQSQRVKSAPRRSLAAPVASRIQDAALLAHLSESGRV